MLKLDTGQTEKQGTNNTCKGTRTSTPLGTCKHWNITLCDATTARESTKIPSYQKTPKEWTGSQGWVHKLFQHDGEGLTDPATSWRNETNMECLKSHSTVKPKLTFEHNLSQWSSVWAIMVQSKSANCAMSPLGYHVVRNHMSPSLILLFHNSHWGRGCWQSVPVKFSKSKCHILKSHHLRGNLNWPFHLGQIGCFVLQPSHCWEKCKVIDITVWGKGQDFVPLFLPSHLVLSNWLSHPTLLWICWHTSGSRGGSGWGSGGES